MCCILHEETRRHCEPSDTIYSYISSCYSAHCLSLTALYYRHFPDLHMLTTRSLLKRKSAVEGAHYILWLPVNERIESCTPLQYLFFSYVTSNFVYLIDLNITLLQVQ
jgi:hypothetical protein